MTVCFGERDRVGDGLLADRLLDLCGRHRIQTSVLLRGAEGFGPRQQLRTDRLLTLSEDLPAVAIAVDDRARISELAEEVEAIRSAGLLTLERARVPGAEVAAEELRAALGETAKLTVYLGRRDRAAGAPAFVAVCELLRRHGVAGASALLGVDGTVRGERRRGRFLSANSGVPMIVIAVGETERIAAALPELRRLLASPLATLERIRVCKRDGESIAPPPAVADDAPGFARRLTLYSSESATRGGHAIHLETIRRLRGAGVAGATSIRGVWGFHGDHRPHGDRLLRLRRRSPIVTTVVDSPEGVATAFEIADELTAERGLVTVEPVPTVRYATAS
jgi:PII-like signaling protein